MLKYTILRAFWANLNSLYVLIVNKLQ